MCLMYDWQWRYQLWHPGIENWPRTAEEKGPEGKQAVRMSDRQLADAWSGGSSTIGVYMIIQLLQHLTLTAWDEPGAAKGVPIRLCKWSNRFDPSFIPMSELRLWRRKLFFHLRFWTVKRRANFSSIVHICNRTRCKTILFIRIIMRDGR